jgi:chemosensory pili system protein ChpA (sensor histidine kinase/response regulator)
VTRGADRAVSSIQSVGVSNGARVLVVDDEDLVRLVIARTLRHGGFDVCEARDGVDALQSIRVQRPDVVLSDVNMPRCNGERLCREIKAAPDLADIPVVLMTGGPIDEERMRSEGCRLVLYKPLPGNLAQILAGLVPPPRNAARPYARRLA